MINNLLYAGLSGSILLAANSGQALPLPNGSTMQIQARGVGAITNLQSEQSSQLHVQLRQRQASVSPSNSGMAQAGATFELHTGLQASVRQQQLQTVHLHGIPSITAPQPWPARDHGTPAFKATSESTQPHLKPH